MHAPTPEATPELAELHAIFESQRAAFQRQPNPPAGERKAHLALLCRLLLENADAFVRAISADFGHRSPHETKILEIFTSLQAAKHARAHVARWMRPERKPVSLWFQAGRARLVKQPLGVVGVIAPWNYPLYLTMGPLVSALAAGNRVMIKPSELTPRFGELLAQLIARSFERDHVAVVNGGVEVARAFAGEPFDHLLFTGSTAVGRQIMHAAAENLTPVTLELGGKSPVIVAPAFPIEVAARHILRGKCLNGGQTCVAPDYVLLPADAIAAFIEAARAEVRRLYPDGVGSDDYTAIINARHYQRLRDYLPDASAKGAQIIELAAGTDDSARKLAPTLVVGVNDTMRLMQEEIFGPILPVMTYQTLDDALRYVSDRPRPLALYYFDRDRARIDRVLAESIAGGMSVNDTIFHVAQDELPFGGVGPSGMGHYHGEEGFNTFSNRKGVFLQSRLNSTGLLMPPFGKRIERVLRLLLR
jgi:coniferyl-aldehyde dehydrogenase